MSSVQRQRVPKGEKITRIIHTHTHISLGQSNAVVVFSLETFFSSKFFKRLVFFYSVLPDTLYAFEINDNGNGNDDDDDDDNDDNKTPYVRFHSRVNAAKHTSTI